MVARKREAGKRIEPPKKATVRSPGLPPEEAEDRVDDARQEDEGVVPDATSPSPGDPNRYPRPLR